MEFNMELAVGQDFNVSDIDSINSALESLDENNDHAILGNDENDDFIQTARTGKGLFVVEYSDETGYFRSKNEELTLPLVKQLFEGFFNGNSDWKNLTQWLLEDDADTEESQNSSTNSSDNLKVDITEQLKRDALNWGKRKLRKFLKF